MKLSIEALADFKSWWGSVDPANGVLSTIQLFTNGSVSVLSEAEYKRLVDYARSAKDEDRRLLEKWLEGVKLAVTTGQSISDNCDLRLADFTESTFPLEACMQSDAYKQLSSYRANPLSEKDTPELFFRRKFQHLLRLSAGITIVDRYFGVNFLNSNSGAQFFFREASQLGVSMDIWTSNPDSRRGVIYDSEELRSAISRFHETYSKGAAKVKVFGVGGVGDTLMHDRMGYIKFFRGRVYFELGQGLEILASKNFARKLFQPATLNVGAEDELLDRYLSKLPGQNSTKVIFSA
jgi:hypothetical protein